MFILLVSILLHCHSSLNFSFVMKRVPPLAVQAYNLSSMLCVGLIVVG